MSRNRVVSKTWALSHRTACFGMCGWLLTVLCVMPGMQAQEFSDWSQTSGIKHVEYRWKPSDAGSCDIEYRNRDERDHRRYKSRIVFRLESDEQIHPYTIVSFAEKTPHIDHVTACSQVTDVSVSRF